jgi:tetrahydromethanopterin S-methyltransferase subunit F
MEETEAITFVDRQIDFNKDIVKASTTMLEGLNRQAKLNESITERLRDQNEQIATLRQLTVGLTVGVIGTAIGVVFALVI